MKPVHIMIQLVLAGTASAALCVPSAPHQSSSSPPIGSAATYTPTSSSNSLGGHNDAGGNSAATYTPTSGSYTAPSFSEPPHFSPSTMAPPPQQSASPCGQLVQNPDFAQARRFWSVSNANSGILVFPGSASCGGGVGADGRTACGQFELGSVDASTTTAIITVTQVINAPGAIVDGDPYQIYVQYRVLDNISSSSSGGTITLTTQADAELFSHDLTNEAVGGWLFLHYEHMAQGTSMTVMVTLAGTKGTGDVGFDTAVQIGEINVVGCRSLSSSSSSVATV
ncbi:hypothetical protein SCUCBS95973_003072 [Sporothrix curviconia]|uniref:Uncharacterized protein n=1 Tax=Sporothrix curviconia TaxID=1260050 RepID=A0ABP0BDE6_9PEZI